MGETRGIQGGDKNKGIPENSRDEAGDTPVGLKTTETPSQIFSFPEMM